MIKPIVDFEAQVYQNILRPVIFNFDSEKVHELHTNFGEFLGRVPLFKNLLYKLHTYENNCLEQSINGINFPNPIGLAAGFDYKAQLTQILPSIGFGFGTIGSITNMPYEGNAKPILGRLPKSKSLMVNKGFKNDGVRKLVKKLSQLNFDIPIGISIGQTNTPNITSLKMAINDILNAFSVVEKSKVNFSYYELNISCPNLNTKISFYPPENLENLLAAIDKAKLTKPVFVKMPINPDNKDIIKMLKVIEKHKIAGVIFGNLQKDRMHPSLKKDEVAKFSVGNFSGKPTQRRSDELIKLAYKTSGKKLTIIGCGGVFSAKDAYIKIKNGASLVQLITGLIFEGPQLPAQINCELASFLKKDGFKNISEAIGSEAGGKGV